LRKSRDDLASDNNTVCDLSNTQELISCADTKTNGSWLVTGVLLATFQEVRQIGVEGSCGTSNAHSGYNVDEGVGEAAEGLHSGYRSGGRNERDI